MTNIYLKGGAPPTAEYRCNCGELIYQDLAQENGYGFLDHDFYGKPIDHCPGCGRELGGPTLEDLLDMEREMGEPWELMTNCGTDVKGASLRRGTW